MNLEKKKMRCGEKRKMEDGIWKEDIVLRITRKCTAGNKVITIRHYIEV